MMTKKYVKGNLLDLYENGDVDHLFHCCNCQGVMGSGIALQIKKRFDGAWKSYKKHEKLFGLKLGTISESSIRPGNYIFNLHAQENYGTHKRQLDYEAFYNCLVKVRNEYINNEDILGFPKFIGCFRAGGSWRVVEAMIDDVFGKMDVTVVIVEYDGTSK